MFYVALPIDINNVDGVIVVVVDGGVVVVLQIRRCVGEARMFR